MLGHGITAVDAQRIITVTVYIAPEMGLVFTTRPLSQRRCFCPYTHSLYSLLLTANLGAKQIKIHRIKFILANIIVYVAMSYEILTR